jgi:transposase InsO family protein
LASPANPDNDKVEKRAGFYQLLTYKEDVDLIEKLRQWESFYNFKRPHGAHNGITPNEVPKTCL